jgi:hypothetical protein
MLSSIVLDQKRFEVYGGAGSSGDVLKAIAGEKTAGDRSGDGIGSPVVAFVL